MAVVVEHIKAYTKGAADRAQSAAVNAAVGGKRWVLLTEDGCNHASDEPCRATVEVTSGGGITEDHEIAQIMHAGSMGLIGYLQDKYDAEDAASQAASAAPSDETPQPSPTPAPGENVPGRERVAAPEPEYVS